MVRMPTIMSKLQTTHRTPLQVKNRLIYNAQFLNCFMSPPSFTMEGISKIPQQGWVNMYMTVIDHKNGYYHIYKLLKTQTHGHTLDSPGKANIMYISHYALGALLNLHRIGR